MINITSIGYFFLIKGNLPLFTSVQFVVPGVTHADSSPVHVSQLPSGPYPYGPNRTVDGNFSQKIRACLHTAALTNISEAWLHIDLQTVKSIKSVKFWYRNDSKYHRNTSDYSLIEHILHKTN